MKKARAAKINVIRNEDRARTLKAVPKLIKLHLGSGERPKEGYVNVDIMNIPGVDKVWDLNKYPWPWKTGSVSEIVAHHFYEHLDGQERVRFMEECYRVLADEGTVELITPYWTSMRAIQDPTHKWPPVCEASFMYFSKRWLKVNNLTNAHPYKANFEFVCGHGINPEFVQKPVDVVRFATGHYLNAVDDLFVKLVKVTGEADDKQVADLVGKLQGAVNAPSRV